MLVKQQVRALQQVNAPEDTEESLHRLHLDPPRERCGALRILRHVTNEERNRNECF